MRFVNFAALDFTPKAKNIKKSEECHLQTQMEICLR
jgi:hypothetical protein